MKSFFTISVVLFLLVTSQVFAQSEDYLVIEMNEHDYWLTVGKTVKFKVFWKEKPLKNYPIFLSSPDAKIFSSRTDEKGQACLLIPEIDSKFFSNRYATVPFSVWTKKEDNNNHYIVSQSILVHPQRYGGSYVRDARLFVLFCMFIFILVFAFFKRKSEEDN